MKKKKKMKMKIEIHTIPSIVSAFLAGICLVIVLDKIMYGNSVYAISFGVFVTLLNGGCAVLNYMFERGATNER